jgi:hypothetical protein
MVFLEELALRHRSSYGPPHKSSCRTVTAPLIGSGSITLAGEDELKPRHIRAIAALNNMPRGGTGDWERRINDNV